MHLENFPPKEDPCLPPACRQAGSSGGKSQNYKSKVKISTCGHRPETSRRRPKASGHCPETSGHRPKY